MLLRYFYDRKLAHASYLVGCQATGEAIVIDPGRDIQPYIQAAEVEAMRLVAATETHIHADFVSGARELAARTGAKLYLSDEGDADWKYQYHQAYAHQLVKHGDTFKIGNLRFEVVHTPGHTPEHICFLLTDTAGASRPMGMFTGDFVFVGDIGRPDLLEKAAGMIGTAEAGARRMFQSINKFKELPDYLQIWPAHGAGSACGKALGAVPSSTVGYEKLFNWAMDYTGEQKFVTTLLAGQPEAPRYFAMMKKLNKIGPALLKGRPLPEKLEISRIHSVLADGGTVVDARLVDAFAAGHLPGTINIPHNNAFANWSGWLLSYDRPFYLLISAEKLTEAVRDLAYIGLDNVAGFFDANDIAAAGAVESYEVKSPTQLAAAIESRAVELIDVRNDNEYAAGAIPGARHIMLGYLAESLAQIPREQPLVVTCKGGGRGAIAASILQAHGFKNVTNLAGGTESWRMAGLPIVRP